MTQTKRARGRPKSQFADSSAGTMQALDRALSVLTAVARQEGVNLTDLSLSLGIPTATTHRILTTLQKRDFVRFDEERQDWTIGIEAYRTGVAYLKRTNLADAGRPVMRRLMEQTGETANLAVPDGAEVVFIGQVETQNPIRAFFPPGSRTPMHASGTGKAILAALPEDRLMALLKGAGLKGFTEETLITPRALFDDLAETRARGWSFDRNERYDGMSCIGAAIFNDRGEPCAGVSISGPSSRFHDAQISEFGAAVAQAAAQITHLIAGKVMAISETAGSH
ncbi:HTH-type transcriptional regulator BhcR [uncultured Roseovarius sp.]|uniref:HTH-type transcriptional regulator BhcR n=1 Tax=uncultured Roseovarius sp. TaxID=293344 RepID=UPI000C50157D|nr:IclR family transcriptional regulator [Roseovarius sp.]MBD11369.1 IclR family transcriptional regulator [Roseovarius sp.]|tara:strand:- start:1352 stop:2194 length:843 start_codon:yes stop_codon:yes gene_type:complete